MPGTLSPRMLIVFLGALVAIGPLSIDMYLPSLPAISVDLAATPDATHLTVSAFLLGFCIGMLVYGPLSDQVGRRVLILLGLGLYTVASIGCLAAEDIHALVALRFLQALGGGAAAVLGRTIVRDVFAAEDAARVLSLMQAVTMLAPLFAPVLGGRPDRGGSALDQPCSRCSESAAWPSWPRSFRRRFPGRNGRKGELLEPSDPMPRCCPTAVRSP